MAVQTDQPSSRAQRRSARRLQAEANAPASSLAPSLRGRLGVNALLALAAVYMLFPVWWLAISATKTRPELYSTNGMWLGSDFHFVDNLQRAMDYDQGLFLRWIGNSILYAGTAALIGTVISVMAGYGLSKFVFPGRELISISILGGLLIPAALLTIPLYFVFNSVGLVNSPLAVIIPSCVLPFGVLLGRIFADTVPDELIEAARMDGAGEMRIFFTMVIRMLAPAMVTIALFIFVQTWNNFLLPLVMLSDAKYFPVTLGLYTWQSYRAVDLTDIVLTGSLVAVVPVVVLFFVLQRYWRSGLTAGSVKG